MAEKPQKSKKPTWVIDKERARRAAAAETGWLFGLHAVPDALANPRREKLGLVVTQNALERHGPCPHHRRTFSPVRACESDDGPNQATRPDFF